MKINSYLVALLANAVGSAAFTRSLPTTTTTRSIGSSSDPMTTTRRFMSEPSDTSSDYFDDEEIVEIESEIYNPTPSEAVVNSIMDLIPSSLGDVSEEKRSAINEALYKLESLNPTKQPTLSSLLNGVWDLRYVGGYSLDGAIPSPTRQIALFLYSGGYSPGIFALNLAQKLPSQLVELDDLEIAISRQQPRVEASINVKFLGRADSKISVKARLETMSDVRLRETYESATLLGNPIDLPGPLQYGRDLYVTYVDEDLLVVRDASGVPEVLVRKDPTFSRNWGDEPEGDMAAPGEEP
eukprot:scaffold2209_cov168-Amphora_coffeaeformis.AAC.13